MVWSKYLEATCSSPVLEYIQELEEASLRKEGLQSEERALITQVRSLGRLMESPEGEELPQVIAVVLARLLYVVSQKPEPTTASIPGIQASHPGAAFGLLLGMIYDMDARDVHELVRSWYHSTKAVSRARRGAEEESD